MPRSSDDYNSEGEDNPRRVLDTDGDFTVLGVEPPVTFKLRNFNPMFKDENGNLIPFPGVLSVRPVPSPVLVQRAREAMGNGTNGVWIGTAFTPTGSEEADVCSPMSLFAPRRINTANTGKEIRRFAIRRRYVPRISGLKTMLLFTDGACLDNGATDRDPRGGWAFIFRDGSEGVMKGVLEQKGPDNQPHRATSNRAELRAVIAALEYRVWWGEGWERIVIATDSEYLVNGATMWLRTWAGRNWRTSGGLPVQNRDLWERLSGRMLTYAEHGCEVSFWYIPRGLNTEADRAAKAVAEKGGIVVEYDKSKGGVPEHPLFRNKPHAGVTNTTHQKQEGKNDPIHNTSIQSSASEESPSSSESESLTG